VKWGGGWKSKNYTLLLAMQVQARMQIYVIQMKKRKRYICEHKKSAKENLAMVVGCKRQDKKFVQFG